MKPSKPKKPSTDLNTKVSDTVKTKDKIDTYKSWFNGIKHFITVKVIPPRE